MLRILFELVYELAVNRLVPLVKKAKYGAAQKFANCQLTFANFPEKAFFSVKGKLRILLLAVTLLGVLTRLDAQTDNGRRMENDPKAQALLDKVSKKYHSNQSMKVIFSLKVDAPDDDTHVQSNGTVYLKDKKYKIDTDDMTIICDNVKRYVYLKESNELQINYFEPEEDEIESPSELFDIYKKDYFYRTRGDIVVDNKKLRVVELVPEDLDNSPYSRIHLYISEDQNTITQAEIMGKDGVKYTYGIKEMDDHAEVNDTMFKFDASRYPGIYIDDMTK